MDRLLRRVAGALAVAIAALTASVLVAPPAGAVSQTTIHPEWVDGCPGCPGPLFYVQQVLDKRATVAVTKSVQAGLAGLIAAGVEKDPAVAKRLHDVAVRNLAGAAGQAGNAPWTAGEWDGDLCPKWPWPWPPKPKWEETLTELADGLTILAEFNRTGDDRLLETAGGKLDAGALGLTEFQGCAG